MPARNTPFQSLSTEAKRGALERAESSEGTFPTRWRRISGFPISQMLIIELGKIIRTVALYGVSKTYLIPIIAATIVFNAQHMYGRVESMFVPVHYDLPNGRRPRP